jgi:hypothetical protein
MEKFKIQDHMEAMSAIVQRDTICVQCGEGLGAGEPSMWVADEGVFHPGCVDTGDEGNKPAVIPVAEAGDSRMTTSLTREQEGVPPQGSRLRREARLMLKRGDVPHDEQLALVRCEAGRIYGKNEHAPRRLRRKGLVEKTAWRITPLGRAVVEELCR